MTRYRSGTPSQVEIHHAHHRLALGDSLDDIATQINRNPKTLARYLAAYKPEVHPQGQNSSLKITLPCGARIEGLSLQELVRLARAL